MYVLVVDELLVDALVPTMLVVLMKVVVAFWIVAFTKVLVAVEVAITLPVMNCPYAVVEARSELDVETRENAVVVP